MRAGEMFCLCVKTGVIRWNLCVLSLTTVQPCCLATVLTMALHLCCRMRGVKGHILLTNDVKKKMGGGRKRDDSLGQDSVSISRVNPNPKPRSIPYPIPQASP